MALLYDLFSGLGGAIVMAAINAAARRTRERRIAQGAADKAIAVIQTEIDHLNDDMKDIKDSIRTIESRSYRTRWNDRRNP